MTKIFVCLFIFLLVFYFLICVLLYFFQEKLIFFPEKLGKNYQYRFHQKFEEFNIKTNDDILLNCVLFKANISKGVIFYLHGNAGSIRTWADIADIYTDLQYDVVMPDFRGYGKSEGEIRSEKQMFGDMQTVYDNLKTKYDESKIVVLGYSLGTGMATKIAADNHPKILILQAPFYSLSDLVNHLYPFIPRFILKYKFQTNKYIQDCDMPIFLFHGKQDEIIYYELAVRLKALIKQTDALTVLDGLGHNGMSNDSRYLIELKKILLP